MTFSSIDCSSYEESSLLKQAKPEPSTTSTTMAYNGTIIMESKPPQSFPEYPLPYQQQFPQMSSLTSYITPTPYQMCTPTMTFGQLPQPFIPPHYPRPQMPLYNLNYLPLNSPPQCQPNPNPILNQGDITQNSQLNQTAIQTRSRLRPISSQSRANDLTKVNEASLAVNRNNLSERIASESNCSRYVGGDYKPYTLKEYKELEKVGIVLGGLGPNIGTKDWEEKKDKMKKMEQYSNQINSLAKKAKKKVESLEEILQKERQRKIDLSNRRKCYEYGKLVRPKSRPGNTIEYYNTPLFKDLGIINAKQNESIKDKLMHREKLTLNCELPKGSENRIKANMYCDMPLNEERSNLYFDRPEVKEAHNESENEANAGLDIKRICKERENYKAKIDAIKETLMK